MFGNYRTGNPAALVILALAIVLVAAGTSAAAREDWELTDDEAAYLADVQAKIDANGYGWTAGQTSVSHLSPEGRFVCTLHNPAVRFYIVLFQTFDYHMFQGVFKQADLGIGLNQLADIIFKRSKLLIRHGA